MNNKPKIVIIYQGDPRKIGGLQHYVLSLAEMLTDNTYDVVLIVNGVKEKEIKLEKGIPVVIYNEKKMQRVFESAVKQFEDSNTIFIIATDQYDVRSKKNNVIVIQHGIAFDDPMTYTRGIKGSLIAKWIIKTGKILKNIIRFYKVKNMVLVDYNFFNWIRTVSYVSSQKRMYVIPNFVEKTLDKEGLSEKLQNRKSFKLLFARRFEDYRGTTIFMHVTQRLLKEFDDITIDFAGDGSRKQTLLATFEKEKRVKVFSYQSKESFEIHRQYDIAVIPTIFSEGTSLSLCEAMGAGCYPVATYVGGLSNILIDNFNGSLVSPDEESLYRGIKQCLTMNRESFDRIVTNAWETARSGFNRELWEKKWLTALSQIANETNKDTESIIQ